MFSTRNPPIILIDNFKELILREKNECYNNKFIKIFHKISV